jgi:hypothetical protein
MSPRWLQADGAPVSCRDKLEVLNENHEELRHVMQDAFEDALLMGVDEALMRQVMSDLVIALKTPKKP